VNQSLRDNTRRSYEAHGKKFSHLCHELGIIHSITQPMSEDDLALIVIQYAHRWNVSSLQNFLTGVQHSLRLASLPALPRGDRFTAALAGVTKYFAHAKATKTAAAISTDDLLDIHSSLNWSTFADSRDWFLYLLAFFAMLRISEYSGNDSLLWRHIALERDPQTSSHVLTINLPFSKTSSQPQQISIIQQSDQLCPVRAFAWYSSFVGSHEPDWPLLLRGPPKPTSSARLAQRPKGLSRSHIVKALRRRLHAIDGRDPSKYTGHSFRRGGLTAMLLAGVPETHAQQQGRWRSDCYKRYFDSQHSLSARTAASSLFDHNRNGGHAHERSH
jgi:hypothetical protein